MNTENEDGLPEKGTKMGNQGRESNLRTKTKNGEQKIRKDKHGEKERKKSLPGFRNQFTGFRNSLPG